MILISELQGDVILKKQNLSGDVHTSDPMNIEGAIESGLGISANWGNIAGDIEDQTDLANILNSKADASDIPVVPSNVSAFTNDAGYLTSANVPTKVSQLQNDAGYVTDANIPTKVSQLQNDSGYITNANIPSKTSQLVNDSGFITSETDPTVPSWAKQSNKPSYTAAEVGALPDTTEIPSKVSQLQNDTGFLTSESDPTVPAWAKAESKPTYTASEVGALPDSTVIPTKTSDLNNDAGFITGMYIMSYGHSTWSDFIAAYTAQKVVYCRASSGSNPGTGSQTRLAFMAYVNNADNPTEVEFQYYRSVSSHSATQQGDQVYVYKLNKTNGWSVTVRESYSKVVVSSPLTTSYSSGTITIKLPTVSSADNGKVLKVVNGAWTVAEP